MNYLAITIGPIYQTIVRARKTRELWAASYIFSLLMREILKQINGAKILLPDFDAKQPDVKLHGAGIWPDRCIIALDKGIIPDFEAIRNNALASLSTILKVPSSTLEPLFQIYALHADWTPKDLDDAVHEDDKIPIHRINRLLGNLELSATFQATENKNLNGILGSAIQQLYSQGYDFGEKKVFIGLNDGTIRLPSLPEIAMGELAAKHGNDYSSIVKEPLDEKIKRIRVLKGRAKDLVEDSEEYDEQLYLDLREVLPKDSIKLRHKYVAIVTADGDNLGRTISALSRRNEVKEGENDQEKIQEFSSQLMAFSKDAVQSIVDYGGLPVYAGGDDLLFIAPVVNETATGVIASQDEKPEQKVHNIFTLCKQLDLLFQEHMDKGGPTLSFGVSISYYKHPLGEAVEEARSLGYRAKSFEVLVSENDQEKAIRKKHALSFQVEKHSGQRFGTTLDMGSEAFELWTNLLNSEADLNEAFLTSVMHKLEAIPTLVADACSRKSVENFRENHFNEGGRHEKNYLKDALKLGEQIFSEYGTSISEDTIRELEKSHQLTLRGISPIDQYKTNILFACLRLKQFLIQKDHE